MTISLLTHLLLGLATSIVGSIPFGTVNLSVINTTVRQDLKAGFQMSIAAALAEIIQSLIAVHCGVWISSKLEMSSWIQIAVLLLMFAIGIYFVLQRSDETKKSSPKWPRLRTGNFARGILLALINPQALPFWVFIVTYLTNADLFMYETGSITAFLIGVSFGKFLVLIGYSYLSLLIVNRMSSVKRWMNTIIGVIFIGIGLVQAIRLWL